jgi:putative heme-binding domain-containing protein
MGDVGEGLGPDLTTLSRRSMRKEILESILFPSHILPQDYATSTVITERGRTFSGQLVPVDQTGRMGLLQLDNAAVLLSPSEIEQILPEKISIMPEGLLDELTLQEIADLFAYLSGPRPERLVETPEPTLRR